MNTTDIHARFWNRILIGISRETFHITASMLLDADPKPMEESGVLVPLPPDMYSLCRRCMTDVKVKIMRDKNGKKGYYRECCGRTKRVSSKNFRNWKICGDPVIELFREKLGIKGVTQEIMPNRIQKIGRRGQTTFLYINAIPEEEMKVIFPVLARFPNTVFVSPLHYALDRTNVMFSNRGIAWDSVSWLGNDYTIHFDLEKIEAIIGPGDEGKITKTVPRRAARLKNIELLTAEMKNHYRRARDHYYTSDGVFLARPTQKELAQITGLRQNDVSRCLNDPDATMLRFLWEHAEDLNVVLNGV